MDRQKIELTAEDEQILFASWVNGNHAEDIHLFSAGVFSMPAIYNAIKEGKNAFDMVDAKLIGYTEAKNLLNLEYEAFYYSARAKALKVKIKGLQDKYFSIEDINEREQLKDVIEQAKCLLEGREHQPKAKDFVKLFNEELTARQTETAAPYGLKDLDQVSGGIHRGQLIVIGARTGVGKSAISLQIADNVQRAGNKVLYFPLEMTTYETFERLLIRHQIISAEETRKGRTLTQEQHQKKDNYLRDLEDRGLFAVYEGVNKLEDITQKIKTEKPYLVVIDQLTQVTPNEKTKDVRERYIQVTRALKSIAMSENVAILLLSQLNREAEKVQTLTAAHLHESDATGQDADVILMLTEDEEQPQENKLKRVTLTLVKQRQGRKGVKIPLAFYGERYDFKDSFKDNGGFSLLSDLDF